VPFAESTNPIENASDGLRLLNLSMFEILIPWASERDCFETGQMQSPGMECRANRRRSRG
jgi:hypothetical protein